MRLRQITQGAQPVLSLLQPYLLRIKDFSDLLDRIYIFDALVLPDSLYPWKPQSESAVVPAALLDAIEGHLEDYFRLYLSPKTVVNKSYRFEPRCHRVNLFVGEA